MPWIEGADIRRIVIAGVLGVTASAAWADSLVVRSVGPSAASYPPGKKVADGSRLSLKPRDVITLLDARGTRTLTGPGVFSSTAIAASDNGTSVLAALTSERRDRRVRIGAVRNVEGVTDARPDIWMVDVTKPGPVCVKDPATVILWRPDATKAAQGSIAAVGGSGSAQLKWTPGQSTQPWPTGLTVESGGRYRIAQGAAAAIEVKTVTVSPDAADLTDIASVMIKNGCATQLDQVVATAAAVSAGS